MSINTNCCSSFGSNDSLAVCSTDGVLHIWDVRSGQEKQQYTPASHLAASFTCLSWKIPHHRDKQELNNPKKKKKKLKQKESQEDKLEFIALGTAVGDILLYNCLNGELVFKYSGGHSDKVNSIAWLNESTFYSCSDDQNIVEWDVTAQNHICKWKAEKREVYSICIGPHSKTILSAGKAIKLWDLKTKELLRRYAGHSTPVISLSTVSLPSLSPRQDASVLEALDGLYFLSAASEDRVLSAWQVRNTKHKKIALCSFLLPSEPVTFDILAPNIPDCPTYLLSLTQDGEVAIFCHALNGPLKKPLSPTRTIKVVTEDAVLLNIISATFDKKKDGDSPVVIVAYGSDYNVAFEQINLADHELQDIVIIRKDPTKSEIFMEEDKMKLREPIKNKYASSIAPGVPGHSVGGISGKKRKKLPSVGESQLTMEERLSALSVEPPPVVKETTLAPTADSFSVLLSQGLQSNDRDVLNQVLQHGNETLIRNTVRQLPIHYIIPLVKELTGRLQGSPEKCLTFVKWLRAVLSCHTSYLMTFPDVVPLLSRLYQLMNVRTKTHGRLSRLEGKLDLVMSQIASRKDDEEEQKPLAIFEEDSSDGYEDMMIDGVTIDHSMSSDDWDDFSDADNHVDEIDGGKLNEADEDLLMDEDG
ncbi:WD repeat-containing protein 43-like [Clavelina lepadiformis]|uniref:WD repeat-containing protein 43-like n=1 Tax=Clavelina lepadiformis TaxID=159417 RepID=UPI0040435289